MHREAQPTNPPRADYRLTALGHVVAERLLALINLVEVRMPEVLTAQERYDGTRATSGETPAGRGVAAGRGGR